MVSISFTVPLVPPSVNHYVKHTRTGRHYVTKEAKSYKAAVALLGKRQRVIATSYEVEVIVFLGYRQKGDGDNCLKVIGDGLKEGGIIHSDAAVSKWLISMDRDWKRPRTEITVRGLP